MRSYFLIWLLVQITVNNVQSQIFENFEDRNLTGNPAWSGDLTNFRVNENGVLQLAAPFAGQSYIYTETASPDSIEWEMYFKMDFSPSGSNKLRIFLMLNQAEVATASGYFIEIGESGSNDAIYFRKFQEGQERLLAVATMGALAGPVAECRLRITRTEEGLWTFLTDYSGGRAFQMEFELFDNEWFFDSFYFGMECSYTGSRIDQFFFDDILVREITPDTDAPALQEVISTDPREIRLVFDELLDPVSSTQNSAYLIQPAIGTPASAALEPDGVQVVLHLDQNLESGLIYTVSYTNIADLAGNLVSGESEFFRIETPGFLDLIVNEVLFDPLSGGSDFIEIYNRSEKYISLSDLHLVNTTNAQEELIMEPVFLAPSGYLALTEDRNYIINNYNMNNPDAVFENDLPALNNADGNVSLQLLMENSRMMIDSFDYFEGMHFELLDDSEGVSLERINPDGDSNDPENWQSASSVAGFATPGVENSNLIVPGMPENSLFALRKKLFSPNDDGLDDRLIIDYLLESSGYVMNLIIYDINGRELRRLYQNEQLATNGVLIWDGLDETQNLADIGMYILWLELFEPGGRVFYEKLTCVLADYLNR